MKYIPFLKIKLNEILALSDLDEVASKEILPFFDIPKPYELDEESVSANIDKAKGYLTKYWGTTKSFIIDSYDIPDHIKLNEYHNYHRVLEVLNDFNFIPTIGLNRHPFHLKAVRKCVTLKKISKLALRLVPEDFEDYSIIKERLNKVLDMFKELSIFLIFDCRVIIDDDSSDRLLLNLTEFIKDYESIGTHEKIILTGSSIHANIAEHLESGRNKMIKRFEWHLFNSLLKKISIQIIYGDYGIVSPEYTDANISLNIIQRVSTPKLFYANEEVIHLFRGHSLKLDPRGNKQYFDLAKILIKQSYYRGKKYSIGDGFIEEKSREIGSPSSQGNWYRMLNNSHITYVCKSL
ncbi:beta protein [Leptospira kirschneri str. 200803703]|uniref:beta family protein n=1 Tax=Leptospira kirschneri TaxID=29507 RepID=UPI0002BDE8D2|nr:beta family protein [Leptospira kirschneri]EMO66449.1 beta protein [Leptospira kirschneri str. 200803703]